ncbi:MAG: hypothetical protein AAFU72_01065 [Pseudomonadota bacterium]
MTIMLWAGLGLVAVALVLIIRVIWRARLLSRAEKGEGTDAAFRRLILENGIALGLAFFGMAMLLAAGILG